MNTMGTSDERYSFLGGLTLEEWFNSPEGEASVRDLKETMERDRRFKQRFAERVKSMAVEEQDRWMAKISTSTKRQLEAKVGEFISENGVKIGEAECGGIFQYNHWKAIQILDCYRFEYTNEEAHEYGHDVFYEIKLLHVLNSPTLCIDGVPVCVDNAYFKTWYEASKYGEWFVLESKKNHEGNSDFIKGDYKIEKIKLSTIEDKINQTKGKMEENFKIMDRDEIANRLNGIDDCPQRYFSFLVINPDYNPSGFSKEIEDSEEEAKIDDIFSKFLEPTKEDTYRSIEGNSKEWLENHSKICKLKFIPNGIAAEGTACMLADGTIGYNYCSDSLLDEIMKVGQIVDLC